MAAAAHRMRFNEVFGLTRDIFMAAPAAGQLKRPFFSHHERLDQDGLSEMVRQQADRAKSGDDVHGCGGFGIVYRIAGRPASARKIGDLKAIENISYELSFLKRLRGSVFVNYSCSEDVEKVKGTVGVRNSYTDNITIRPIMADSYRMPFYHE